MTTKRRLDWVDAGRGLAITLVVLFHAARWLNEGGFVVDGWLIVNDTVASMRMPLFFVMAGLFAQKWITVSWSQLWRGKLSLFVWVYGVWSVIATFTFMLGLNLQGAQGNYLYQLVNLVWAPVLPRFELWFIWSLALFFVAARLIRRAPVWLQLGATAILSATALSGAFASANTGWSGSAKYFFFFLTGLLLKDRLLDWSSRARIWMLCLAVAVWLAVSIGGMAWGLASIPGYYFACCLLGLVAGLGISKAISPLPGIRYLGSRTLPVYLTHTSVIIIVVWVLVHAGAWLDGAAWGWVLAPSLSALAIAASLGLARWSERGSPQRYLFVQPPWFAGSTSGTRSG